MLAREHTHPDVRAARHRSPSVPARTLGLALAYLALSGSACEITGSEELSSDAAAVEADATASDASDMQGDGLMEDADSAATCRTNADCPDYLACDDAGACSEFTPMACDSPCTSDHPCDPRAGQCRCEGPAFDPDADKDTELAIACGGTDCNDHDFFVKKRASEICDPGKPESLARDEDCEPTTFYHTDTSGNVPADQDEDGYVTIACVNIGPEGEEYRGDDCNDGSPNIHPHQTETCDELDNNCNGSIDELEIETGDEVVIKPLGLRAAAYPDNDGDGHGDQRARPEHFCKSFGAHPGKVFEEEPTDPDDDARTIFLDAPEICDGKDNDSNGKTDADDTALVYPYQIPLTTFACEAGDWKITQCPSGDVGWCGGPLADGCSTDMTRLESCRACTSNCKFACGRRGCTEVKKLALGYEHSCALSTDGRVACWGAASFGRLGRDASTDFAVARWNPYVDGVHDIAAGYAHSCAILGSDRELWCWGSNEFGQLGSTPQSAAVGTSTAPAVRVQGLRGAPVLTGVNVVSAGENHTCAALVSGELICFGWQSKGRLGNQKDEAATASVTATFRNERVITLPDSTTTLIGDRVRDISSVSLGQDHGCALRKDGVVECWGDNTHGQLGDEGTLALSVSLRTVPNLAAPVTAISAGRFHTCALAAGAVYCWGLGTFGRLGDRGDLQGSGPGKVLGVEDAVEVACGMESTCVRLGSGEIICWGDDSVGTLGPKDGAAFSGEIPPLSVQDSKLSGLSIGDFHACAIRADGQALCWGANGFGQLGASKASQESAGSLHLLRPVLGSTH